MKGGGVATNQNKLFETVNTKEMKLHKSNMI